MQVKNITHHSIRGLIFLFSFLVISFAQADTNISPIGNWTSMNANTKKSQAVIQLWENEDHIVTGKIIKVYDASKARTVCKNCPEDFQNKPLVGMEMLWGLSKVSDYTWNNGRILSPKRGMVFPCNLTVSQDGQTITIRIYNNGTLAKTQIWYRAA